MNYLASGYFFYFTRNTNFLRILGWQLGELIVIISMFPKESKPATMGKINYQGFPNF
jgi:hypothetical protein